MEGGEDDLNGMIEIIHYVELLLPLPQKQEWLKHETETS